jgi:hypothetical protein
MDPGWRHGETLVVATAQHPGAVIMVSAHTVIEFGLMHHQELQDENQQVRRVMAAPAPFPASPGVVRRTRSWLSVVLIRLGTWSVVRTRDSAHPACLPNGPALVPER